MANKRQQLYEIVRQLRRTLDWHEAVDAMGSLPASEEAREAFEAKMEAHREAKREEMRASLMDEDDAEASSTARAESDASTRETDDEDEDDAQPWSDLGSYRSPEQSARADESSESRRETTTDSTSTSTRGDDMSEDVPRTNAEQLEWLRNYLGDCQRCPLHENRTNIVFGEGDPEAELVFVGEAPGYHEDQQGRPFVGKAGTLLNKMIRAMGIERGDTYICNVLKSRPPDNRDPNPNEIASCIPFLEKQIDIIQPEVICTLGRPATQNLLDTNEGIGQLRGTWQTYEGIDVMPTYHPAYLLRNESMKPKTWDDLRLIIDRLDLPGPNG
jgi:DNA polymerase